MNTHQIQYILFLYLCPHKSKWFLDRCRSLQLYLFIFSPKFRTVAGILHFADGNLISAVRTMIDDDDDDEVCWCSGHESRWSQPEEDPAADTATLSHCHSFPVNDFPETLQPEATEWRGNIKKGKKTEEKKGLSQTKTDFAFDIINQIIQCET